MFRVKGFAASSHHPRATVFQVLLLRFWALGGLGLYCCKVQGLELRAQLECESLGACSFL